MAQVTKTVVKSELRNAIERKLMEMHAQVVNPKGYSHNPALLNWLLQELVEGRFLHPALQDVYPCIVDYGLTLKDIIRSGEFELTPDFALVRPHHIKDQVANSGQKEVVFSLFNDQQEHHFSAVPIGDNFRHATFVELLCFARSYPQVVELFTIKALGTIITLDRIHGGSRVAEIRRSSTELQVELELTSFMFHWSNFFLVVQK